MWNPLNHLTSLINKQGGFVNAHAHFDRAYSITPKQLHDSENGVNSNLELKWHLNDAYKMNSTELSYYENIVLALRLQEEQGIKTCLSFIDCDPVVKDKAVIAAQKAQKYASTHLHMKFLTACQTVKGVLETEARNWFEKSLEYVDIIGGLPGADKGREAENLDVLFQAAKSTQKRVHVHVDQLNTCEEKETELLCKKIMQWGLEGQVSAIHGISIASHKKEYRKELYKMCRDANLSFIACPTAWIDSRRSENLSPTHNAVTPIDELFEEGITVALGSDNICDLYKPFADGNLLVELRVLLESNHFYNTDALVQIATINGLKVLGLH